MAYASTRHYYGYRGCQYLDLYLPTTFDPATDPAMKVIAYRPGGAWGPADPEALFAEPFWKRGLNDSTSANHETYAVALVNGAHKGSRGRRVSFTAAWVTATAYTRDTQLTHVVAGVQRWFEVSADHTSAAGTEPGVGASWATVFTEVTESDCFGTTAWITAGALALGDVRVNAGHVFRVTDAHTADAAHEPGVGADWDDRWSVVYPNDPSFPQVVDTGESEFGYLDAGVYDFQLAITWLMDNGPALGVLPDKVVAAGASAGGHLASLAVWLGEAPWGLDSTPAHASKHLPRQPYRPAALIARITPMVLENSTNGALLSGVYGRSTSSGDWADEPLSAKRALSPLSVLKRTGLSTPTYLHYTDDSHDSGGAWDVHAADNGWDVLEQLTSAQPVGLGRPDCRFVDADPGGGYRAYTQFNGTPTNIGSTDTVLANDTFTWLNARLA